MKFDFYHIGAATASLSQAHLQSGFGKPKPFHGHIKAATVSMNHIAPADKETQRLTAAVFNCQ